ncbi:endo-1,4-beta-glucanase [Sorangium sp. So ce1151]|uniref:endo-1,4-beta-glucanase n=1 Tax=Sorangium sp. So ce1151 TaxID=3133332 RepID=UPI003F629FD1
MKNLVLLGVLQLSLAGLGCGGDAGDSDTDGAGGDAGSGGSAASGGGLATSGGGMEGTGGGGLATGGGGMEGTGGGGLATGGGGTEGTGGGPDDTCAGEDACPFANGIEVACRLRFMYGVNYAWRDFYADFGGQTRWGQVGISGKRDQVLTDLRDMRAHGVDVVRWWLYPRLAGDIVTFDGQGDPSGLGATSRDDILAALELADQAEINVMFTVFSFDGFYKTSYEPPTDLQVTSLGPIVADPSRRARLIENVVRPSARTVASSPHKARMLAWDVINEPEWAMTGPSLHGGDPPFEGDASKMELVTHAQMEALARESAAVLREETGAPVSVGSAAIKWGQAWTHADVDFYQVHMYGWVNDWYPYDKPLSEYGLTDKPVVMGEFPIDPTADMDVSYDRFVSDLYSIGYAGALSWSFTGGPWSSSTRDALKAFAGQHPCETRY